MPESEDESRTRAVGRKRKTHDQGTAAASSSNKQRRLEETFSQYSSSRRESVSSKESGEISSSGDGSLPPPSPNGGIFERWERRNVSIPLPKRPSVPSVLETAMERAAREAREARESEDEDEDENENESEDGREDEEENDDDDSSSDEEDDSTEDEDEDEESDYEPPHTIASPEANVKAASPAPKYPTPSTREIRVKDLDPKAQDLQYKYFWDVEEDDLVFCLSCGGRGHMYENCMDRICKHCGALDEHASVGCHLFRKCTHCRQRGHDAPACTSMARPPNDPCDVCGEAGHLEVECFLRLKPKKEEVPVESPPPSRSWQMSMFDDSRD